MGWLRKKGKQLGRGIKKVFKGVGKAFNKVFGGLFKKLGPIGSIALMFLLPGIGQMFTQGLSWLQTGFTNLAGGGTWGTAAQTTARRLKKVCGPSAPAQAGAAVLAAALELEQC